MNERGEVFCDDAVAYLNAEGYSAANRNGVAMIYLEAEVFAKSAGKILKQIRKQLEAIGYTGSTGVAPER